MRKKLAILALVVAAGGCRMCSDCCDYSPTVPGGLPMGLQRSGSALGGNLYVEPPTPEAGMDNVALPALTPSPNPEPNPPANP